MQKGREGWKVADVIDRGRNDEGIAIDCVC